jgi:hypothetical protein
MVIRRQTHGIKVKQLTITLPGDDMERLRREALGQRTTASLRARDLIRLGWQAEELLRRSEREERSA